MKKNILIALSLLLTNITYASDTIYVDLNQIDAIQTGESWTQAFTDLHTALDVADWNDEIWVTRGTYYTSHTGDRDSSFILPSGVSLYGAFLGNETDIEQRDIEQHTVLNGRSEFNSPFQGSFHILRLENADTTARIDGFVFEDAFAHGNLPWNNVENSLGSAIFHRNAPMINEVKLNVHNCIFRRNGADRNNSLPEEEGGGVIFNEAVNCYIEAIFTNCLFEDNIGDYSLLNNLTPSVNDSIKTVFNGCTIRDNAESWRGFIKLNVKKGKQILSFINTDISNILNYGFIHCLGDTGVVDLRFERSHLDSIGQETGAFLQLRPLQFDGYFDSIAIASINSEWNEIYGTFSNGISDVSTLTLNFDSSEFKNVYSIFLRGSPESRLNATIFNTNLSGNFKKLLALSHGSDSLNNVHLKNVCTENIVSSLSGYGSNSIISISGTIGGSNFNLIDSCSFSNNFLDKSHPILGITPTSGSSFLIRNTQFTDNHINDSRTGIINIYHSESIIGSPNTLKFENCLFQDNVITYESNQSVISGLIGSYYGSSGEDTLNLPVPNIDFENCIFDNNRTETRNLIRLTDVRANWSGCLFTNNEVINATGSLFNLQRELETKTNSATFTNCTFSQNTGRHFNNNSSELYVRNSILAGDSILTSSNEDFTSVSQFHSNLFTQSVCPAEADVCDANLFSANPDFDTPNFSLSPCSPAVNAGNSSFATELNLTQDIAGESRFQEAQVDIGAYETPSIAATVLSVSPDTCSSAANGALDLDITSFCPPLIYAWADQTNTAAAQLPAGSYPLSITDAAQRTLVLDITIPDTLRLQLSSNVLVPDCTLSQTGSIEILVSEGLAPYQYLWSDNNMQSVRNDILGGEYTITVSNDFGCRDSLLFNIAPEGELSVSSFSTPITCHDTQDGIIDVDVMGGFEDLNFIWQDGDTSQNQINLSAGSYTVSVTDNYGCAGEDTTNLMSPEPILIDFIITNSTSSTAGDGQIEITSITGGLAPYTLLWNTGDQDSILENISFGNYSLSILDERGCQKNFDFYVDFNSRLNTLNNTKKLLFPNPVERGQKVKVLLPDFSPITYQWIDGQGRLTKKGKIATNQSQFITPNVAGIYLLKLNDEMRKIVCMKVVVF